MMRHISAGETVCSLNILEISERDFDHYVGKVMLCATNGIEGQKETGG